MLSRNRFTYLGLKLNLLQRFTVLCVLLSLIPWGVTSSNAADSEQRDSESKRVDIKPAEIPLGINLAGVVDHSTEMPFNDLFLQSRPWISQTEGAAWGTGPALDVAPDGTIKRLQSGQFATAVMCSKGGQPAGRYVCLYDGDGDLQFDGCIESTSPKPGRIDVIVKSEPLLFLHLKRTNPKDPLRNIRIYMPETRADYESQPFRTAFLDRTRTFGVIRFMDWMKTNNSKVRTWEDRPKPTDGTQTVRGVALEYMIQLCNTLHREPWFCMPHLADDRYVRKFAEHVKANLHADLRVHIEYSNEVWNTTFEQAKYAREQGNRLRLGSSDYEAQLRFASKRAVEMFRIWEDTFGSTQRLVRVLGSQSVNPWVSEQVATYDDAYQHADAIAIAPYFGNSLGNPKTADAVAALSVDEVLTRCREDIDSKAKSTRETAALAKKYGLQLMAYEGGQHLVGYGGAENNERLTKLFHAANQHDGMKDLYLHHLKTWKKAGGARYVVFSSVSRPSKWGSWGLLESEIQDGQSAPKFRAVAEFLQSNPIWWRNGN